MDALLSSVKKLQPSLGQGLGSGAAGCKWQVLRDAFHKDEPKDRTKRGPGMTEGATSQLFAPFLLPSQREGLTPVWLQGPNPGQRDRERTVK